jgi:hypothetical protein
MGKLIKDMVGKVCGRLTVIEFAGVRRGYAFWRCRCSCGRETVTRGTRLRVGDSRSCGCLCRELTGQRGCKQIVHGHARASGHSPEYRSWERMRRRCSDQNTSYWKHYGARGITVCQPWQDSFEAFLAYVGPRPSPAHSLDRIDNDGNYESGNVRWATRSEQQRNRRPMKLTAEQVAAIKRSTEVGITLATRYGVDPTTIYGIRRGRTWRHVLIERQVPPIAARSRGEAA